MKFNIRAKGMSKGFTLLEVMAVTAIMALVVAIIYPMITFGTTALHKGQVNADKQYQVRMAADFISKQLRYANSFTFLTSTPTAATGRNDIYLDASGFFHYNNNGTSATAPGVDNTQKFEISFLNTGKSNSIIFTISDKDDVNYDIATEVILLNYHKSTFPTASGSCIGFSYTLPSSL